MKQTEFEDAKLLWKSFYAAHCFRQAREAAQYILDNKLEKEAPLFHPLVVGLYTLYAKPFTRADGVGRLEESFVPKYRLEDHKLMMKHRHEIYAHRDADGFQVADLGVVNQIRVVRTMTSMALVATEFHARWPLMPKIIQLCRDLEEKSERTMKKLWGKHKAKVPKQVGEFALNVLDQNSDIWIPKNPRMILR